MQARPQVQAGAIAIAREGASCFLDCPLGHWDKAMNGEEGTEEETAAELAGRLRIALPVAALAVRNGCTLAVAEAALAMRAAAPRESPAAGAVAARETQALFAKPMPAATAMMQELFAIVGPEIYGAFINDLCAGRGFVVDLTTNIALGNPPVDRFERGRIEQRHGFTIMRVRPKAK